MTVAPSARQRDRLPLAGALLISVVAGLVLGVVDLVGELNLPYPWADLANSAAVWSLAAFVLGWGLRLGAGTVAGIAGSMVASANPASRLSGAALAAGVVVVAVACTA